MNSLSLTIQVS